MQMNVNIILSPDDPDPVKTPDELAQAILEAVNGVPEKDTVAVFLHRPTAQSGVAGAAVQEVSPPEFLSTPPAAPIETLE